MVEQAISAHEFERLLAPFVKTGERIAVAVSGGPDSMALTFLVKQLKTSEGLLALIVEHGLRDESAQEAAEVATRLRAMEIETEILPWRHDGVKSRVHVQARAARYGLLIEACKRHGITTLALAHHAGDQVETILMRFAKGSGIDGLAGMSAVTEFDGVRLVRPLLGEPKARLIATCEAHHIVYVTDPSNTADKYARGRLRHVMPLLESEGFTVERLLDLGDRAREAKAALDHYAHVFLREAVHAMEGGAFRLDLASLRGLPRAVALRALTMLLTTFNQEDYPPERKNLIPVLEWLLDQDEGEARTLHGVLVQKGDLCDKAIFLREPSAITEAFPLVAGPLLVWDGRWNLVYDGPDVGLEVRALGLQTHDLLDELAPHLRSHIPQGRVRASLPAVWRGDELVAIPSFTKQDQGVVTATRRPALWE